MSHDCQLMDSNEHSVLMVQTFFIFFLKQISGEEPYMMMPKLQFLICQGDGTCFHRLHS